MLTEVNPQDAFCVLSIKKKPDMHIHVIDKDKHKSFLEQERFDPVTGDLILPGDRIVICAGCKSAFHLESWEYLQEKHCDQQVTLAVLPGQRRMQLLKPLPWKMELLADPGERFAAFVVDMIITLGLFIIFIVFMMTVTSNHEWIGLPLLFIPPVYLSLRDVKGFSFGRRAMKIRAVSKGQSLRFSAWVSLLRNYFIWLPTVLSFLATGLEELFDYHDAMGIFWVCFVTFFIIDVIFLMTTGNRAVDRLVNTTVIRKRLKL